MKLTIFGITHKMAEMILASPDVLKYLSYIMYEDTKDIEYEKQINLEAPGLIEIKENYLELEKEWHGVAYIFTEQAWDSKSLLGMTIFGEAAAGSEDDYGSPRILFSDTAKKCWELLSRFNDEEFERRYNDDRMNELEIYNGEWEEEWQKEETFQAYKNFIAFFKKAVSEEKCLLYTMT